MLGMGDSVGCNAATRGHASEPSSLLLTLSEHHIHFHLACCLATHRYGGISLTLSIAHVPARGRPLVQRWQVAGKPQKQNQRLA